MFAKRLSMLQGGVAQLLVSTVFGARVARERYAVEEQMVVQMGFQAEFSHRDDAPGGTVSLTGSTACRGTDDLGLIGLFIWAMANLRRSRSLCLRSKTCRRCSSTSSLAALASVSAPKYSRRPPGGCKVPTPRTSSASTTSKPSDANRRR